MQQDQGFLFMNVLAKYNWKGVDDVSKVDIPHVLERIFNAAWDTGEYLARVMRSYLEVGIAGCCRYGLVLTACVVAR